MKKILHANVLLFLIALFFIVVIGSDNIDGRMSANGNHAKKSLRFKVEGSSSLSDQLILAQNMCLIGLRGVNCGGGSKSGQVMKSFDGDELIVSGNGYDRWTHEVKPQVIQSRRVDQLQQVSEESIFVGMSTPQEFYAQLYPLNGQSTFFNGLYSRNGGADEMFNRYFEGSFNVYDTQKQFITHQVSSYDTSNVTFLFRRIIDILPTNLDTDMYQQVITTFGDSVTTSVHYGGVVDSTVSVRQCFSDGNMETYVKDQLNSVLTGSTANVPDGYARYHKVSSMDIVGGNPETSSVPERVASFIRNPVPIKFQTVPIWTVFPEGEKRNNMKQVYDQYVNSKSNMANQMVQQLENKKIEEQRKPKVFKAFLRNKQGVLQDFGEYALSIGQKFEFTTMKAIYLGGKFIFNIDASVSITRHEDSNFHVEVQQYTPGSVPGDVQSPPILYSNTVFNWCASVGLPVPNPLNKPFFHYSDWSEVVVCSGGQIMLAGDQRSVVFGCPYVY